MAVDDVSSTSLFVCLAGVPFVTLAGSCHAHNVGVSLLTAVGLTADWVRAFGRVISPKRILAQRKPDVFSPRILSSSAYARHMFWSACSRPSLLDKLQRQCTHIAAKRLRRASDFV